MARYHKSRQQQQTGLMAHVFLTAIHSHLKKGQFHLDSWVYLFNILLPKYEVHIEKFHLSESDGSLRKKRVCDRANVVSWASRFFHGTALPPGRAADKLQLFGCGCGAFPQEQTKREPLPSSAAVAGLPAIESELWQKTRRFENVSPPLSLRASQYLRSCFLVSDDINNGIVLYCLKKCINMWKTHIAQWTSIFQTVNAWRHKTTHAYKIHSKCKTDKWILM